METLQLREDFIKLGQALKASGLCEKGSDAKFFIQEGRVTVNGETELRRGRKLVDGDEVTFEGQTIRIQK